MRVVLCERCPLEEECGLSRQEHKACPLVDLIMEHRFRLLKRIIGRDKACQQAILGRRQLK